jgi:hypothetical protein
MTDTDDPVRGIDTMPTLMQRSSPCLSPSGYSEASADAGLLLRSAGFVVMYFRYEK